MALQLNFRKQPGSSMVTFMIVGPGGGAVPEVIDVVLYAREQDPESKTETAEDSSKAAPIPRWVQGRPERLSPPDGSAEIKYTRVHGLSNVICAQFPAGCYTVVADVLPEGSDEYERLACVSVNVSELSAGKRFVMEGQPTVTPQVHVGEVSLTRAKIPPTEDEVLWIALRASTNQLAFPEYEKFMNRLFMGGRKDEPPKGSNGRRGGKCAEMDFDANAGWLIANYGPYAVLRKATEFFVMTRCGVREPEEPLTIDVQREEARLGHPLQEELNELYDRYLVQTEDGQGRRLPVLHLIGQKLGQAPAHSHIEDDLMEYSMRLLQYKLTFPCMLELIWSYWHEEGMLVQSMNAIAQRFQNLRATPGPDPLRQLEIDPLRSMNQLLWGFVQDETNRLSVLRRAYEYDHHYGFTLHGRAVGEVRSADRRSKFLESFHNLLHLCSQFYRQDDDTTVVADGFPILNAIRETHYLLAHGAHNQFGDLPATARVEMLVQQYILARPEMREFLGGRVMVPYPETWMDRVDAVKNLKGWTDTSVVHFHDLAVFGEQIVLGVRWGAWTTVNDPNQAAQWARYWRPEIQGYQHAYRAVTGIDLTAEVTDQREAALRYLPPSTHLKNRLLARAAVK